MARPTPSLSSNTFVRKASQMNELTVIDKAKPVEALARLHSRSPLLVQELFHRINRCAYVNLTRWRGEAGLEEALEEARSILADLPRDQDVAALAAVVTDALATCTEPFIRQQVAQLIGAFPNASPTDPETYVTALMFDLRDARIPDAILMLACQEIRRTSKFVPAIAEIFQEAKRHLEAWEAVIALPEKVSRARQTMRMSIEHGEEDLRRLRDRPAKQALSSTISPRPTGPGIHYPSLAREFEGDQTILNTIAALNADHQCAVSVKLVREGRTAAEALIRQHSGVEA